MAAGFYRKLRLTLDMVRFEHSIFALPFALTGVMLAFREDGFATGSLGWKLVWIVIAMVSARSSAMAFNRLVDQDVDSGNPRTASRHLPAGLLTRSFSWSFVLASSSLFFLAAAMLSSLCLKLAPLALGIVLFYSFTKRFTSFSHVVLGFCLGIAPAAAWIAIRGSLDPRVLWLTAAVTLWTAGFDIIYSCQDFEFDRRHGLFSLPARIGISGALWTARGCHAGMLVCLTILANQFSLNWLSALGILAVAALLIWEHSLVSAADLSRVNAAFFTVNGYVSVIFFFFWAADILLQRTGI